MLRLFVSLIFACLVAGCDDAPIPEEADRRPVKLYTVAAGGQARTYEFPAIIEASTSSDLTFDVPGKIVRLTVDQGDFVRAGTVIAQLDQTIARNQLVQAREQYEAAQDAFRRADALVGEGAIPRAVHVQRETQRDTARAELDNAREQLEKTVLRAPFSGRVARRLTEPFEYVSPQQPVVTLQTAGSAKVVVQVPSSIVANAEQRAAINAAIADGSQDGLIVRIHTDAGISGERLPSLTVALKGLGGCQVDIRTGESDLHSGMYGATVPNALQVATKLAATFHTPDGKVAVDGFYDKVTPLTEQDRIIVGPFKILTTLRNDQSVTDEEVAKKKKEQPEKPAVAKKDTENGKS